MGPPGLSISWPAAGWQTPVFFVTGTDPTGRQTCGSRPSIKLGAGFAVQYTEPGGWTENRWPFRRDLRILEPFGTKVDNPMVGSSVMLKQLASWIRQQPDTEGHATHRRQMLVGIFNNKWLHTYFPDRTSGFLGLATAYRSGFCSDLWPRGLVLCDSRRVHRGKGSAP